MINAAIFGQPGERLGQGNHVLPVHGEGRITGLQYSNVMAFAQKIADAESAQMGCAESLYKQGEGGSAAPVGHGAGDRCATGGVGGNERVEALVQSLGHKCGAPVRTTLMEIMTRGAVPLMHDAPEDALVFQMPTKNLMGAVNGELQLAA